MLGVCSLNLLVGCATTEPILSDQPAPGPMIATSQSDSAVEAARAELGDEAADALPRDEPRIVQQVEDAGAESLVATLAGYMEGRPTDEAGFTTVVLDRLRNQSNASAAEFAAFQNRLVKIMDRPGREIGLRFDAGDGPAHYRLGGTAYLVSADGFDQWELYLRLTPGDAIWTLWQNSRPIRVLRQPRPGHPQFTTVMPITTPVGGSTE